MNYFLYCRKSTEESAGKQLNSLESQEEAMRELAEREDLKITKVYRESQSASKTGRPVLEQMLAEISAGKADGILCWKLDRLARNMLEGGYIFQMLQDQKIKEIRCYDKTYNSSTNAIVFGVELGQATQYSVELKANVNRGMMFKFRKGIWPTLAPIGYKNTRVDGQAIVIRDEINAPLVTHLFEEFSKGTYSLRDIAEYIYEKGLTTRGGNKIHIQKIADILDNPFYYGEMNFKGEQVTGIHEPIITKELFRKVQDIRHNSSRPRPSKHFFPFRGLFKCEVCSCSITAEKQKGNDYYHCTNGKGVCDQKGKNVRGDVLSSYIADNLESLQFDEEWIDIMYQASLEKLNIEKDTTSTSLAAIDNTIKQLEARKKKLSRKLVSGALTDEEYLEIKKELNQEINTQLENKKKLENRKDPLTTLELTKNHFIRSNRAKSQFETLKPEGKQELLKKLLSNCTIKDKNLANFQYKSPYKEIAEACVNGDFHRMWTLWEEVRTSEF